MPARPCPRRARHSSSRRDRGAETDGTDRSAPVATIVPSPSCPDRFSPHAQIVPPDSNARQCCDPAAIQTQREDRYAVPVPEPPPCPRHPNGSRSSHLTSRLCRRREGGDARPRQSPPSQWKSCSGPADSRPETPPDPELHTARSPSPRRSHPRTAQAYGRPNVLSPHAQNTPASSTS